MAQEQSLAEQYVETAINMTAKWTQVKTRPFHWVGGMSPAKAGRLLLVKDNLRYGWYQQPPKIHYKDIVADWASPSGAGLYPTWRRFPGDRERETIPHVHAFDRNGSYLGVAKSAMLPFGTPEWHDGAVFVKEEGHSAPSGIWHVTVDHNGSKWNGYELPAVCPEGDDVWLWSATVQCAQECGYRIAPAREHPGAIIWPEHHKVMGVWGEHLWRVRLMLDSDENAHFEHTDIFPDIAARRQAISLIKKTYSLTISTFSSEPNARREPTQTEIDAGLADDGDLPLWRRPEWMRTIHADAAARMFYYARRAVDECGYPPMWMQADTIAFGSALGPEITADTAGLNTKPRVCGAMHYDCTVPMSEPALVEAGGCLLTVPGRSAGLKLPGVRVRHD